MIKRFHFLYIFCFSILFFPFIEISSSFPALRPEWFLLAFAVSILPVNKNSLKVSAWYIALIFSMFSSFIYGALALGVKIGFSDVFEFLKPVLYYFFFSFARSSVMNEKSLRTFLKFLVLSFVIVTIIALIQYFGGGTTFNAFLSLYVQAERIDIYAGSRATATMSNPNDLGMLLVIGYSLSLFSIFLKFPYKLSYIFPFVLFIGVIITGSRTAFLSSLFVTFYFFYQQMRLGLVTFKSISYVFVIIGGIIIVVLANSGLFSATAYRFFLTSNDSSYISLIARFFATLETLTLIKVSPVFGWGANKLGFTSGSNIDNEYMLFLYRYGTIGLFVVIGVFYVMKSCVKKYSFEIGSLGYFYSNFLTAVLLSSAIFAYAAGIYHVFRLCTLIVVLLGVGASLQKKKALNIV